MYGSFILSFNLQRHYSKYTIKWLRPSDSVGLDGIPSFIVKGCFDISERVLKFIFNLSLSQRISRNFCTHAPTAPFFKTGKGSSVGNYRLIAIRNIFLKVFEFIIHGHVFEVGFTLPEVHPTPEMWRIFKTSQEMKNAQ